MKFFYLKNKRGFPVTCVASKIVHPLAGQPMVYFDFATHNPADRYDRKRARETAAARLEKYGRYGVYLRLEKGETRRAIVEEIAKLADSQAAREAARLWLQGGNEPVRPGIEVFLRSATEDQRIAVDEFIGVLDGTYDSGSIHSVLQSCVKAAGIDYVVECLETIKGKE